MAPTLFAGEVVATGNVRVSEVAGARKTIEMNRNFEAE
jgi:hypothetical protein